MSRTRQEQLMELLMRANGWTTAADLADMLGVTPRSVRSYIAQINSRTAQISTHAQDSGPDGARQAVESGPAGYRADRAALAALRGEPVLSAPQNRLHALVRELLESSSGIDLPRTAARLHVSEATLEADLQRVRGVLESSELSLERSGPRAVLVGEELAQRRLISRLAHEEMERGPFDVAAMRRAAGLGSAAGEALGPFARTLADELGALGYYVNELASAEVTLHAAITADRAAMGRPLETTHGHGGQEQRRIADLLGRLCAEHFKLRLGPGDLQHLASLVLTRLVAPGGRATEVTVDSTAEAAVREAVRRAAKDYLVDLEDEGFMRRLGLHVQNLVLRAREQAWSRNPMTRSLKSAYPMIFEVAVSIASDIGERLKIPLHDDEIAYIAMHVGGQLERSRQGEQVLTATIVSPGYYELHELLRSRIAHTAGPSVEVTRMETGMDPDWESLDTDLVLSTIEPPVPDERTVHLAPFLTESDVERIGAVATKVRRSRRLARLGEELERYLSPEAFFRPLRTADEEEAIRLLGAPLVARGVIDEDYVERTVERERMSSTAFTEGLAVPHALQMTATTTAISIGIAEGSVRWGEARVQVVALVAFSEEEREAFQTVFEQLMEVFSERDSLQRLLRRGTDFPQFLTELAAVIDG